MHINNNEMILGKRIALRDRPSVSSPWASFPIPAGRGAGNTDRIRGRQSLSSQRGTELARSQPPHPSLSGLACTRIHSALEGTPPKYMGNA